MSRGFLISTQHALRSIADLNLSAVDLVTAEIRRAILTGALPPGEQFSIRELARQLGVSHIPIREALRQLEGQGLIVLRQARSAEVASLSMSDIDAIYALRLKIEPAVAAEAVPLHTQRQIDELERLLAETSQEDPDLAWKAHHDFHLGLVAPAATAWDLRVLRMLWASAERYTHLIFDPTHLEKSERLRRLRLHAELLDQVKNRDSEGMRAALTKHLTLNEDQMRERLTWLEKRGSART